MQASVVVPTRGGAKRLPTLLRALREQTYQGAWEVVFVLDGVVDDTPAILDEFSAGLSLRRIERDTSTGIAGALRAGYTAATGRIVLRCDDDITPAPGWLERHLAWHQDGVERGVISVTRDEHQPSRYAEVYGRRSSQRLLESSLARPREELWMCWAACNSVPRATYERLGGFDETLTYREDNDFGLRLQRAGVELVIDPELVVEHRGPATSARDRARRAFVSGASLTALQARVGDDVVVTPAPPTSVWGRAVRVLARLGSSQEAWARFGAGVDHLIDHLPTRPARAAVAVVVEAAGVAGQSGKSVEWRRDAEQTD